MHSQEWIYRFGDVEVEPAAHRISRAGAELGVEPKAYAVLVALLEQHGRALERDALLDRVWGHRHVTPGVLNRVVAQLRKALGDDAEHPRYIQTLHSLGYRFIGEVERLPAAMREGPADGASPPAVEAAPATDDPALHALAPSRLRHFALASALALGALVIGWLWQRQDPPRPEASIAVLPFASLSDRPEDSYFAEGLAVEMHDALAGVPGLKVAARMSPAVGERQDDPKTLGSRLGVAAVLDASVRREGGRVRINTRLSDTRTGYTLWSKSYDREMSDVFALQSDIAGQVVHELLGAMPDVGEALAKRLTPTTNVTAFDAYLKGLQQLMQPEDAGRKQDAIGFFNQALAVDRGFARAQAGICRSELWRFERTRDVADFSRAQVACKQASEMNPALGEVDLAMGELHRLHGEPEKALERFAKAQNNPALKADAYIGMAKVYDTQGRQALALDYFERARELRPGDAAIYRGLGYQQYQNGRVTDAIASYRKALELQPGDAGLWASLGGLYISAGDNAAAAKALERSIKIKPTGTVLSNLGALKNLAGDHAAAVILYRRATQLDGGSFLIWGFLGDSLRASLAPAAQTREAFLHAADMAERYVQVRPDDARALAALGWYRVNLGQAALAREHIAGSEALGTERGEVALFNAQTLVALGDVRSAHERVAAARKAGVAEDRIAKNGFLRPALEN